MVSGRVVDTRGAPQADLELTFHRPDNEWLRIDTDGASARAGTFRLANRLVAGTWRLEVGDRQH